MDTESVCYTLEAGLEKAIEIESNSFESYKDAYQRLENRRAKELAKEIALDELEHKYTLEKAFFEETVSLHDSGSESLGMQLTVMLADRELDSDATEQDVMIHAIHNKKRIVEFYRGMSEQCSGAPMEKIFRRLCREEQKHLAELEEFYEKVYMPDN